MSAINIKKNNFPELRKKAEEKLKTTKKKSVKPVSTETGHELNVHKIELEMQNEELRETQLKLVKSIENYSELFDYAPVGYFILDCNGVIINVNIKGSKLVGIDRKQLKGIHLSVFLNGESCQDDYYRHRNLVIETNELKQFESEIRKKDGSIYSVLIESIAIKDEQGTIKNLLSTITDISAQKKHEQNVESALAKEIELSELKSRFITMASHEFKTPLSTILSSAFLIDSYGKTADADKRRKHTDKIKSAVDGLKEILTEFLSFSQIEKNLINNNPETFNIIRFTEDTISEINTKTHTFIYKHIGKDQDVYLDAKLLKICLINLLSNAIKYSPNKGIIEILSEKNANGDIVISVKDRGIGIAENEKQNIFEQFFRAKNAETIQGTGLGLNIVQKLALLMDGDISFESKLHEGTVFVLRFSENKKNVS